MIQQSYILVIHIIVAILLGYLGFSIVNKHPINVGFGYFLMVLAVGVVGAHIYFYMESEKKKQ